MAASANRSTLENAWGHLAEGNFDELAALYAEEMIFVLPGQENVLKGRMAFRSALDQIGAALPQGFEIDAIEYFEGNDSIFNLVSWHSEKLPAGSQSAIHWRFDENGGITEERWFVDTEQWKTASKQES